MITINPYLNFHGNAEEAFIFYKSVFGGEFRMLQRIKDTPEASKFPEKEQNRIMHVALPIGEGNVLMASDVPESMQNNTKAGNNFYISVSTDNKNETKRIYDGLSSGGTVEMPLEETFWGSYFGMFKDKYGVKWMVSNDIKQA